MALFESVELPKDFAGVVRLFPLPDLVVFPHVVLPLHIFEPRYREMLEDALAGDHLIAMALLQPGWEPDYEERPAIFPVACLGRVISHARLPDGRYNILLQGARRATILREFPPDRAFRMADVAIHEDVYHAGSESKRSRRKQALLQAFRRLAPDSSTTAEQLDQIVGVDTPLGVLADVVAYASPLKVTLKQQLLAEWDVDRRSQMLLEHLLALSETSQSESSASFPPGFSPN